MGTKNYRNNASLKGFTLVELLIVFSLIAILVVIGVTYFQSQLSKGNDAKRKADINRIKIAAEEYEKDHSCYPQYITCGVHSDQPVYPYLNNVPCDPATNASYVYENDNSSSCPKWYRIYTNLINTADTSITPGIGTNRAFNYYDSSPNAPIPVSDMGTSTPAPSGNGGGGNQGPSGYWGCRSGVCEPIGWDNSRPGPECDPSFHVDNCYNSCVDNSGSPKNECVSWK